MKKFRAFVLGLFLVLLAVEFSLADSEVSGSLKTGVDPQLKDTKKSNEKPQETGLVSKPNEADTKKGSDGGHVSKPKEGVDDGISKKKPEDESGSKENDKVVKGKDDSGEELKKKDSGGDKEKNSGGGSKVKEVDENKGNGKNKKDPLTQRNEGSRVEECGSSNKCTDDENNLVACLRVPGNDLSALSLLVQNKGKSPLSVAISAPDFVQLEETNIELQENGDRTLKVSFMEEGRTEGESSSMIILKAGNGYCNLDIKDLSTHNFGKEFDNTRKSTSVKSMSQSSTIIVLSFAALLILASGWACISFRKKQISSHASKYQRLDMELPVSGGGKTLSEINDGWDDSWGNDWDDEEAPKTPSMPVTPSLSSKGLAPRRLNKEGWKD